MKENSRAVESEFPPVSADRSDGSSCEQSERTPPSSANSVRESIRTDWVNRFGSHIRRVSRRAIPLNFRLVAVDVISPLRVSLAYSARDSGLPAKVSILSGCPTERGLIQIHRPSRLGACKSSQCHGLGRGRNLISFACHPRRIMFRSTSSPRRRGWFALESRKRTTYSFSNKSKFPIIGACP